MIGFFFQAEDGIRASPVSGVQTCALPILAQAHHGSPRIWQERVDKMPLGRMGQPEDIASGILYLASDESSFVTGAELVIDGGMTAQ